MPILKIERILSCSSEDPNHPAVNLTSTDRKTWKCKNAGEKQASVVLQLEKEAVITSIDIGNENSAFIEVLVGRSSTPDVDFEVLLVASSFMSPMEARISSNPNRVRMFATDKLSKPVAEQKWDRIKVVCTQPFNRHIQYGVAFVTFHSVAADDEPASSSKLGRFVVKNENDELNSFSAGSLFARRKDTEILSPKGAAAIREASSPAVVMNRKPPSASGTVISQPSSPVAAVGHKLIQKPKPLPLKEEDSHRNATHKVKGQNSDQHNSKARKKDPVAKKPKLLGKPFGQLLEGVVLVISGYQNPHRANLRAMALEMGARYKSDWDSSCTHLVCAFPNTPKFQQVRGKGHIVCKEWIENCYSKRKRLPWRRFALDRQDQNKPESEDEIPELFQDVPESPPQEDFGGGSEVDEQPQSGSDTEDEIERVRAANPYDEDTDVDSDAELPNTANIPLPKLSNFFDGKYFHLHEELNADVGRKLKRYITAFKGSLLDRLDDARVNFVISNRKVQSRQPVVKPDWVWECNDAEMLLPTKPHEIL